MMLDCKDCKSCSEREDELSRKMDDLLGDLNIAFKDGQRRSLTELKRIFNAVIDVSIESIK